ncbi:hypothetical protein, conserved [Angomonas deanei]|uniref:Uncharacterized protein n=1 Tax=Angomonas deanei TaxID=59799 RepID=A0A7G2C3I1_9TRYP|nr:hypothetical protein, conserved [Angomonas deanei]
MGVPDLLKFVARATPSALCKVPMEANSSSQLQFDFVFVDATNIAQTISFPKLMEFLQNKNIKVSKAVVFALDSQRDRVGTARHHRQTHLMVGDLDVQVQKVCMELQQYYNKSCGTGENVPKVLISGRNVYGEADYKLLSLHRNLVTAAIQSGATELPKFLFISEDSDIVGGLLCGPAPQCTYVATVLRHTLSQLHVLQVSHVMAYIAMCVDVFAVEDTPAKEEAPAPEPEVEVAPPVTAGNPGEGDDVVRRKKVDGPMVAVSKAKRLSDSSDDDDEDASAQPPQAPVVAAKTPVKETNKSLFEEQSALTLASGHMLHSSAVDLVFLFILIMGNELDVPPIVKGATKVDILSCWHLYCKKKFANTTDDEKEVGKSLLNLSPKVNNPNNASMLINGEFLSSILDSVHYSDALSRPPVPEEITNATLYLSKAAAATVRYIVACDTKGDGSASQMLDTRSLLRRDEATPSLSSLMFLLRSTPTIYVHIPICAAEAKAANHNGPKTQQDICNFLTSVSAAASSWASRGSRGGSTVSIFSFLTPRPEAGFSVATSVKKVAQATTTTPPGTPGTALFSCLEEVWKRSVSLGLEEMKEHCTRGKFISPVTGAVANAPLASETQPTGVKPATESVYSFELRRMTPVVKAPESAPSSSTTDLDQQLLAMAGISLDYATQPAVPKRETTGKRERPLIMDDEEKKELKRALKLAKKEQMRVKGETAAPKEPKETDAKKKKPRLGKKERQKLQRERKTPKTD